MATALRAVRHEDQLTLVEHLDELRTRLIVSLVVFLAVFGFCFWQQDTVVGIVNHPFEVGTKGQVEKGAVARTATFQKRIADTFVAQSKLNTALANDPQASAAVKAAALAAATRVRQLAGSVPKAEARQPVTLGVAEPFTQTFKVAAYAALLLSLPLLLWQAYAFVLPAFSKRERQVALPLMAMVPILFAAGASFAYFVVLPQAIKVLQNFNAGNFDILIQAKDLYRFIILTCIAMGALFQVPVGILLLTRMEIITVKQLRANRRYAILVVAVLAMLLPGTDPVTMLLAMAPLLVLYEGSIVIAAVMDRRVKRAARRAGVQEENLPAAPDDD